ncbi:Bug family tripartite tricarboxylate transporter substrate binding protein [Roseateles sp. PN1]|uniref:Bug family tripartite tricarboxylate transporter substrate binding protein n=1 Tax=Roseateles sp. PN1 TaxID=3137372 RepID=UPI003138BAC0
MQRRTILLAGAGAAAASALPGMALAQAKSMATAAATKPAEAYGPLRLLVPAAQGSGWDQTARAMASSLQASKLVEQVEFEYKPGKGGVPGLAYFVEKYAGQPGTLMVGGMVMLGAIALNRATVDMRRVTPIARLTASSLVVIVPKNSPLRSQADLNAKLKTAPASIRFGGGSAGGVDHMLMGMMGRALEVPPANLSYQPFAGGGELLTAMGKGELDVGITGFSEAKQALDSGAVRALAISSRADSDGIRSLRSQGVATDISNWRGLFAPPGLDPAQIQKHIRLSAALNASPAWVAELKKNRWSNAYTSGAPFAELVETEQTTARVVLHLLKLG